MMTISGTVVVNGRQVGEWSAVCSGLKGPVNWWRTTTQVYGDKSGGWVQHRWSDGYATLAALVIGSHNRRALVDGLTAVRERPSDAAS